MTHDDPHTKAADAVHDGRPVEAQYVRQGRGGARIFILLIVSLLAVTVLLLGLWMATQGVWSKSDDAVDTAPAAAFQDQSGDTTRPADATP